MRTQTSRTWRWAALVAPCLSVIAVGCGDSGSPVSPSAFERSGARAISAEAATFTLWRFENGQFVGTLLAIRPDLYCGADVNDPAGTCTRNAPLCGSTGQPYSFVPVIRYYTCLHTPGR